MKIYDLKHFWIFVTISLAILIVFISCDKDKEFNENGIQNENTNLHFKSRIVKIKDIPKIESIIFSNMKSLAINQTSKKTEQIIFDDENISEVIDKENNTNYSIRFELESTPENIFYNLIINVLPSGKQIPFVIEYKCNPLNYASFKSHNFDFAYFVGDIILHRSLEKFKNISGKTSGSPCLEPIVIPYNPNPTSGGGGGDNSISNQLPYGVSSGSLAYSTGGYGLSVSLSPSTSNGGGGTNNTSGSINAYFYYFQPTQTKKSTATCDDATLPQGFIGLGSLPLKLRVLEKELNLGLGEFYWLNNNRTVVPVLWEFLKAEELAHNDMEKAKAFAFDFINQMILNPSLKMDIGASYKSPFNIDRSSITYNLAKPENQKFNEVYDALVKSPEFQKLFVDLFDKNIRFNVKFEIVDHVYEKNDPTKNEVHATTSEDPVTRNIVIKISKQILSPDGTMKQTKIENAKTILHECIHAYLFVKAGNPNVGVDFVSMLNEMYPTPLAQHDFMYNNMIPTMQKVLGEIRDLVTTTPKRTILEGYTMHPTINPLTNAPFNWADFYKFISYSGLDEASCFKEYVLKDSNLLSLFNQYVTAGKIELDR